MNMWEYHIKCMHRLTPLNFSIMHLSPEIDLPSSGLFCRSLALSYDVHPVLIPKLTRPLPSHILLLNWPYKLIQSHLAIYHWLSHEMPPNFPAFSWAWASHFCGTYTYLAHLLESIIDIICRLSAPDSIYLIWVDGRKAYFTIFSMKVLPLCAHLKAF